jgi:integrase
MGSNLTQDFAHMCKADHQIWPSTSDNLPLSVSRAPAPETLAAATDQALDPAVAEYLLAARAPNTHRAYACDLADFEAWSGHVPSNPDEIARYVAQRASTLRPSTLRRRLAALASIHRDRGFADPTKATLVRRVVQGIERKHGRAVQQAAPLLIDDLARIVAIMGTSDRDLRDRAILLVGFFGALRRSEIVALDVASLIPTPAGLAIVIVRSKTDQTAAGRVVQLSARDDALCPVSAISAWLSASGARDGPLFRRLSERAEQNNVRLGAGEVAKVVKRYAEQIGLDAGRFSGHSLRAGFVTSAALAGVDIALIARQTGHRTQQSLAAYARPSSPPQLRHC